MPSKTSPPAPAVPTQGRKLMDQVGDALRTRHYAYRTEQTYKDWIKRSKRLSQK